MGDVSQVWLNSSPSATSQQMMDRHVGQIVRRDGPAVKFWIHYSSLFVHVTEADSFHMREPAAPFREPVAWPAGRKQHAQRDDGHLKQTWLHWLGSFIFTTLSMKMGYKVVAFCCRDRVLSVWMTSSFQYFILKKENNRIKVNYWPKLLRSRLWYHANEYNWVAPI
jgi:hypothetical protein